MRLFLVMAAACGVLAVQGCASISKEELATANFGSQPSNYEESIKMVMSGMLKDPMSAQYNFGTPAKGVSRDAWLQGGKKHFGYIVPVSLNAKNSFGGYTGFEEHLFFIGDGQVRDITDMYHAGMAAYAQ